jgi:hypothetical protein
MEGADAYTTAALEGAIGDVRGAPKGERNAILNRAAHGLGRLVGAGRLGREQAEAHLAGAAAAVGLDAREAKTTIASGLKAGERSPRALDELRGPGRARRPAPVPEPIPAPQDEAGALPRFKGTRWPNRQKPDAGEAFDLDFAELRAMVEYPAEAQAKESLPQLALATFRGNHRSNAALEAVHGLALDGDGCNVGLDTLREVLGSVCHLAHTTWRHTPDCPRWRILIPLSRPASAYEARRLSRWAARLLPGLDDCPPSQGFYIPAKRPGYDWRANEAPALDVDRLLEALDREHGTRAGGAWRGERLLAARRLVAAAVMDPELTLELDLDPAELPDLRLREVYGWIKRKVEAGEHVAVLDVEHGSGLPADVVNDLVENVWTGSHGDWPAWLERLREGNRREGAILACESGACELEAGSTDPDTAAGAIAAAAEGQGADSEAVPMGEAAPSAFDALEAIQDGKAPGVVPTGFPSLEPFAPSPGDLVVVGARTSVGKTQTALQIAYSLGHRNQPAASLFVSAEMSVQACVWRLLSWASRVPVDGFRRAGGLTRAERDKVQAARARVDGLPIYWSDQNRPERIASLAARLQRRAGIRVVFVDYLQRLTMPRAETRNLAVGEASKVFADLAKRTGLVVYLLSQLRRPGQDREKDPPRVSDLRDSGSIEQDADVIYLLHREPFSEKLLVGVAKNRQGRRSEVELQFHDGHILDER